MNNQYVAYGDVNPIEHGGRWVKKVSNQVYDIVTVDKVEDLDNTYTVGVAQVDINDSWIDKASVENYTDVAKSDEQVALDVVGYYGVLNCGGDTSLCNEAEAIEMLQNLGVTL